MPAQAYQAQSEIVELDQYPGWCTVENTLGVFGSKQQNKANMVRAHLVQLVGARVDNLVVWKSNF